MISFIAPVAAGNAVQILLSPPTGAIRWRILRKRTDTIAAADDPAANLVHEGEDKFVIDRKALLNGTAYFYRAFYLVGTAWVPSASRTVTPVDDFADLTMDPVDVVRERIDLGFAAYLAKGRLHHRENHIPVLMATPAIENAVFPLITIHLISNKPYAHFVGEVFTADTVFEDEEEIGENDGELSSYQIQIGVWCTNGDVRATMRKALKAVVKANLNVFEAAGMSLVEDDYGDNDLMEGFPVPIYQAVCMLSCVAPSVVQSRYSIVRHAVAGSGPVPLDELEPTNIGGVEGSAGAGDGGNRVCPDCG